MATALSMLMPEYCPTFLLLAVLVAVSRIIAGAHYPSDVVAGMLLGIVIVPLLKRIFDRYELPLRRKRLPWP
jgi:membrane-associated phospholipid phosphatase